MAAPVVAFVVAMTLGRLLRDEAFGLSLVHPAVGIGAVWLAGTSRWRCRAGVLALIFVLATAVAFLTQLPLTSSAFLSASTTAGAAAGALLIHRLWRAGPALRSAGDGVRLVAASLVAGGAATAATWLQPAGLSDVAPAWFSAIIFTRAVLGCLLVIGLVGGWRTWVTGPGGHRPDSRAVTVDGLLACAVYWLVFVVASPLPIAFLAIPVTLWIASRGEVVRVLLHSCTVGLLTVGLTAGGYGPFSLAGIEQGTVLAQAYIAVVAVIGLGLVLSRSEVQSAQDHARAADTELDQAREATPVGVVRVHVPDHGAGVVLGANPAACRLLGFSENSVRGVAYTDLVESHERSAVEAALRTSAHRAEAWSGDVTHRLASGPARQLHVTLTRGVGRDRGSTVNVQLVDVSAQWASHERFHIEVHDPGTDLPNGDLLVHTIAHAIYQSALRGGAAAVVLLAPAPVGGVDLALEPRIGDQALRAMAARLRAAARPQDTVALTSARDLAVCCPTVGGPDELGTLADHYLSVVTGTIAMADQTMTLRAHGGVALSDAATNPRELLRRAGYALKHAKATNASGVQIYTPELTANAERLVAVARDLRRAIGAGEFVLHYQPIIDIHRGATVALEALVRWQHPTHGLLAPAAWMDVAESQGHIVAIGEWVLAEACRELARLRGEGFDLTMQVNVSARQLEQPGVAELVRATLLSTGIPGPGLTLEVTETHLLQVDTRLADELHQLRREGVRIAADDFGTGFSSLQALIQIPLDDLKIDRSFVAGLPDDLRSRAVVHGILGLARGLNAAVIAEGVEHPAQARALRRAGCRLAQGYLWSRPLPPDQLRTYLHATGATALSAPQDRASA